MKQIIIPTENRPGEIATITGILAEHSVNIRDIDAMEDGDHGFIMLCVDDYDEALDCLRAAGYRPVTEDAIVIQVPDEPGALAKVASRFAEKNINVRSLHIMRRQNGNIHVSLSSDDNVKAAEVVSDLIVR
ncbi:amino acid-binding protein [Oceaniferula spumae]|uniref:Amino acid-binding protein n=1 Tax=Oceaniferula spumae TaxID=2979115 RepID=A0AAT9FKT0_9BACT